ncbi:MAG: hypothetical protein KC445_07550 [Anaerolineales bacterium]|nr:hypothetical protein [Anaerolineales bacterium]
MPLFVAIMGVDGSGKTTVIKAVKKELEKRGFRVHVWHRNKRFVNAANPIAHHKLPPYSKIVSIGKLLYKATRWVFSYYFTIAQLRKQGVIVISDHFYFYYLAMDPIRFRYGGPQSLAWKTAKHVPNPDVKILLRAPFDVVNQRKQELSPEAMRRLIQAHDDLSEKFPDIHRIDANQTLTVVVPQVIERIKNSIKQ